MPINLLIELCLRAMSEAMPELAPAGAFADQMPTFLIGTDPVTSRLLIQGDAN